MSTAMKANGIEKPYSKSRKIHTKSRTGCAECKRRHIRCDETRPICNRCVFSNRGCSYVSAMGPSSASHADSPIAPKASRGESINPTTTPDRWHQASTPVSPSTATPGAQDINLDHLELLHHFEAETCKTIAINEEQVAVYHHAVIAHGLNSRSLMSQILALSALHLSLCQPRRAEAYRSLASGLQAAALTGFHDLLANVDGTNCVDVLLFSHLVTMHVFCDTFASLRDDFNAFMGRLVGCIRLLNGGDVILQRWWKELSQTEMGILATQADARDKMPERLQGECQELKAFIEGADLSSSSIKTCLEAVRRLQHYLDIENSVVKPSGSSSMIFAWLVTSAPEFTDLLGERKPEALVILAYYAVLLHKRHECWVIGDAGARLFHHINQYLGPRWRTWLAWPSSVVGVASNVPTPLETTTKTVSGEQGLRQLS
jgi:Fungal Zn(2)-Cys(6) binuclear cluster domain/Fungal specific transcription factor domain